MWSAHGNIKAELIFSVHVQTAVLCGCLVLQWYSKYACKAHILLFEFCLLPKLLWSYPLNKGLNDTSSQLPSLLITFCFFITVSDMLHCQPALTKITVTTCNNHIYSLNHLTRSENASNTHRDKNFSPGFLHSFRDKRPVKQHLENHGTLNFLLKAKIVLGVLTVPQGIFDCWFYTISSHHTEPFLVSHVKMISKHSN